jgi:flagellum-specific peptidoglycan hydrolase FlgJ
MKNDITINRVIPFMLIVIGIVIISHAVVSIVNKSKNTKIINTEYSISYVDHDTLGVENVWNYIHQIGIQHPHIVYAQFQLESGSGNSFQAVAQNNLFGMMVPSNRIFVGFPIIGTNYAGYINWKMSIIDYAFWQVTYAYNLTEEEYLLKLDSIYAEDPDYINKILILINKP